MDADYRQQQCNQPEIQPLAQSFCLKLAFLSLGACLTARLVTKLRQLTLLNFKTRYPHSKVSKR